MNGKPGRANRPDLPRAKVSANDGIYIVDKPAGLTSHDVVACFRRLGATKKVGHAGTLDPLATGILVLGLGRGTKFLTYLVGADKTYLGTIRLGQGTNTDDSQGEIISSSGVVLEGQNNIDQLIESALVGLRGDIMQVPAAVSAIKINGVRAYAKVRGGEEVVIPARPVNVSEFVMLGPARFVQAQDGTPVVDIDVKVQCSSGTYIRSLARDLGQALGWGGHLTALRRTRVGIFGLSEAKTLVQAGAQIQEDNEKADAGGLAVISLEEACRRLYPSREVKGELVNKLRHGASISPNERDGVVACFDENGQVLALTSNHKDTARPLLVIKPA